MITKLFLNESLKAITVLGNVSEDRHRMRIEKIVYLFTLTSILRPKVISRPTLVLRSQSRPIRKIQIDVVTDDNP